LQKIFNMKTSVLSFLALLLSFTAFTQVAPDKYFVKFTDKNNSPFSVNNPSAFLSQRAIDRRTSQGIPVVLSDIPVNPEYLQGVAGTGATILNPTKWLNGVTIYTTDPSVLQAVENLPYVAGITKSAGNDASQAKTEGMQKPFFQHESVTNEIPGNLKQGKGTSSFDYGFGLNQIHMLNGDAFHDMGYRGQGKVIAVLDAGFYNANVLDVFDSIWQNGQVLGTHDFVRGGAIQYDEHTHGTMVLSCMAANYPGQMIGTAPKASFYLLRSEDGATENLIEEYNWVSAAEYADSVGADLISSSLGYTEFDDPTKNHTYADMNGDTAPSTIGADMAAKKGLLVIISLGNEGSSPWYYLSAPSDGDSVMGIGAVDGSGLYAGFSSHGPSYDGRTKPDVVAQGQGVCVVDPFGGGFTYGSGTSFSAPILAGMAACLWQANSSLGNMQIANAIRESGSQYNNPDDLLGNGIPDFVLANDILTIVSGPGSITGYFELYPNPFTGSFTIDATGAVDKGIKSTKGRLDISDVTGRHIISQEISFAGSNRIEVTGMQNAPKGIYFATISLDGSQYVQKIIKR
jgi:hypothetical protein